MINSLQLTELIKAVGLSRRLLRRGCVSASGGLVVPRALSTTRSDGAGGQKRRENEHDRNITFHICITVLSQNYLYIHIIAHAFKNCNTNQ